MNARKICSTPGLTRRENAPQPCDGEWRWGWAQLELTYALRYLDFTICQEPTIVSNWLLKDKKLYDSNALKCNSRVSCRLDTYYFSDWDIGYVTGLTVYLGSRGWFPAWNLDYVSANLFGIRETWEDN